MTYPNLPQEQLFSRSPQTHRFCRQCERIKILSEFAPSSVYCNPCRKILARAKMERAPIGRASRWPRVCLECNKSEPETRFRFADPTICVPCISNRMYVRGQSYDAVRAGRLRVPSKCQLCFEATPVHIHHRDYSKPLKVLFLCARCHRRTHENVERARHGKKPIPLRYW